MILTDLPYKNSLSVGWLSENPLCIEGGDYISAIHDSFQVGIFVECPSNGQCAVDEARRLVWSSAVVVAALVGAEHLKARHGITSWTPIQRLAGI